ncbi:MAG TPA: RNA 2',3'-cyclic phosphodiesterase [Candidatus Dormibacteraeota bacterium]|nr:RNA 2',3'-cyclic phosphodiesterase [Candidatus Dormibacteraeota bacterium]
MRAFFGLPVPEAQCTRLEPYLQACSVAAPQFRWTPAANLHLTVRFIGGVERAVVDEIAGRLDGLRLPAFELALGRLGTFKRGRLVRVVWLQVGAGADQARELAAQVEAECVLAGLEADARPFQPHLTLARARPRDGANLSALPDPPSLPPWPAGELVLYSSHLGRAGAVYEPLRQISLR